MNEELLQKLSRRVKLLNILLITFGLMFILLAAGAAAGGYIAVQEVRKANDQLTSVKQTVTGATDSTTDLQKELCNSEGTLGALLNNQSDICN